MLDLDAIKKRSDTAMDTGGETNGYVIAGQWYGSARDVPALIAEINRLQAALNQAEHHNLPDKPCPVCAAMAEEDAL